MTEGIKDKVVVITGASSGLGEATARHLGGAAPSWCSARAGSTGFRRSPKELSLGADAAVRTDVTKHEEVKALVERAVRCTAAST